ncbi:DUF6283 family protein [Xanthomonas citri pv. citri]|uniref:DUF6283 family protein n=1 Tax=Xanthomonas TaxID=338 RepID=UPI000950FE6F|nr:MULTISPECIES: DUF6283 family protein [Xanthomonas]MBD5034962.1 hypothetical protein [Xanthomonas citri pv. citri]MBD5054754.1 hypothetical protein [Xanthomonas citri pv. citri]MCC8630240.1 DUF6283 family protein [Xanthomonas vesicatoria]OLR69699.1 hypothetical protein BI311_23560 [Xanthomonas citri pv. citri]
MYSRKQPRSRQLEIRPAGGEHQVVTVSSDPSQRRQPCAKPCSDCPWRIDAISKFPAEAFVHSARTAYDMAETTFACHQAGASQPRMCAGFLLRGAEHNLTVRLAKMRGEMVSAPSAGGHALHVSYAAMAIANGVPEYHPALAPCRVGIVDDDDEIRTAYRHR